MQTTNRKMYVRKCACSLRWPAIMQREGLLRKENCMESQTHETTPTRFAIRPFRINVPEEALVDLRRRVAATRWPDRETVADRSQGVPLATIQPLVRYWGTEYD